jgi:hypothetical protein
MLAIIRFSLLSSRLLSRNLKVKINKIIILPVVLYGCETWSVTLREEHRLRVFSNRVLREVMGEWRKLHSGELHSLHSLPDIIRHIKSKRMRWAGHAAEMGEWSNVYRVLVGKPEGKGLFERQGIDGGMGSKWTLGRLVVGGVEWIHLAQDRDHWRAVVNAVTNFQVLAPQIYLVSVSLCSTSV